MTIKLKQLPLLISHVCHIQINPGLASQEQKESFGPVNTGLVQRSNSHLSISISES